MDCQILPTDVAVVNVKSQPTILRGSPTDNKAVFDNYCDMIVEHFNDLCEVVDAGDAASEIAPSVLTLYGSLGWTPDN